MLFAKCRKAECSIKSTLLNVITRSVIMLSVIMLNVVAPNRRRRQRLKKRRKRHKTWLLATSASCRWLQKNFFEEKKIQWVVTHASGSVSTSDSLWRFRCQNRKTANATFSIFRLPSFFQYKLGLDPNPRSYNRVSFVLPLCFWGTTDTILLIFLTYYQAGFKLFIIWAFRATFIEIII